jgi:hypothetical protein
MGGTLLTCETCGHDAHDGFQYVMRGECRGCTECQTIRASTPDPDSRPCDQCGGGLDHYPECPISTREA